ncbi:MAG: hypothetical protein CMH34_11625 [Microbacterium sp.]|nr:hypothetical protein [Microbacterium sp.]
MAWMTAPGLAGPAHASAGSLDLLSAGIGLRFRILDAHGLPLASGRWLNSHDCEPAEHPHHQPLTDLAAAHPGAVIEFETTPGRWHRY